MEIALIGIGNDILALIFAAFAMEGVDANAHKVVEEIRRHFMEIPRILEGKAGSEYAKCVDIVTAGALGR